MRKFRINAFAYVPVLSSDGNICLVNTYGANTDDAGKIIVFDTREGKRISRFSYWERAKFRSVFSISQDSGNEYSIVCSSGEVEDFLFDLRGNFRDEKKFRLSLWKITSYSTIIPLIEHDLEFSTKKKEPFVPQEVIDLWLSSLDRIKESVTADNSTWKAEYYRTYGRVQDRIGNYQEAIKAFHKASSLKPKIGVKKRYDYLMKHYGDQDQKGILS
ncbi:tetratricopeptide repeat protein [Acetobacteraceae bacterium ESL0709]|nr:tetratricopeptide repeat protein [Acetobacteraceae bacterium ESL0697]MDF7677958.1 tetratricopeptide repeat protein [Acetobacteraceae bacterium ESL0709]